jgi:hypothetical protein
MKDFSNRVFTLRGITSRLSFFAIAALFMLMTSSLASGQTAFVGYDFTGNNTATATFAPTTTTGNVTASIITRGAGAPASSASNSFRTTGFQNNGISTANTDFFQFSVAPTAGNTLSLSALNANLAGTGTFVAAPGVTQQFAFSLDGTNFTLIGSPQTIAGTPQALSVDLTGVSALQNVAPGTTVTFRYFASGQTATGGFGFFSAAAGTNGLAISGTTAPIVANTAPTITSANSTTFTVGQAGTFTVTTTGTPTPTLSFTGTLPAGVTFTDNGNGTATIAGTPAAGTNGSFPITITASNGTAPNATQNFTLTVNAAAPPPPPASTVIVTSANPQGFRTIATAGTGTVTFVVDPLAPAGVGALQLTAPDATAKADFFRATSTLLVDVTELSFFTKQEVGSPAIAGAAYQLRVCLNGLDAAGTACNPTVGGTTTSFSTLVFEPYLNSGINGNPVLAPGVFQQFDVDAGLFSSTRTVVCSGGTIIGSSGSSLYTLLELKTICPDTLVFDFGVSIGANNAGFVVRTDLVSFNNTAFNFEPSVATAAGVSLSGRVAAESGRGIMRATVMLTGGNLESPVYATTDFEGNYNFSDIPAGETYVLSVFVKGYKFNQTNIVVNLNEDYDKANFIGTPKQRIGTIR